MKISNRYLSKKASILLFLGLFSVVLIADQVLADKGRAELVEESLRALSVSIDIDKRDFFFDQLRKFSDKHAFAVRLAPNTPDGKSFIGQMWREDIKLVAVNPFEEDKFRIYFYQNGTSSVDEDVLDALVADLSALLVDSGFAVIRNK